MDKKGPIIRYYGEKEEWLTLEEAAQLSRLSVVSLRNYIHRSKMDEFYLPHQKVWVNKESYPNAQNGRYRILLDKETFWRWVAETYSRNCNKRGRRRKTNYS